MPKNYFIQLELINIMSTKSPVLHIVHCIDTEGPLIEDIYATFNRLESIFGFKLKPTKENLEAIQNKKIDFGGLEDSIARTFSSELLKYNTNWTEISEMLERALSSSYRRKVVDDFDNGWVYSWHCMDHLNYFDNPRRKDIGYGNIFRYYKQKLEETNSYLDEINWHFHPLSLTKNPTHTASSYVNNYDVLMQIICRRILEDDWFPVVNRPGFHTERPDSHSFLEHWIPFDYANQVVEGKQDQHELNFGRFADWQRASQSWRGFHPSHNDYQLEGNCNRLIFRILNIGTRHRELTVKHFHEAFREAKEKGGAIIAFADHDYRDITPDVDQARKMLLAVRDQYSEVKIKFSGAEAAACELLGYDTKASPKIELHLEGNRLVIKLTEGEIFGPQPFLSIKTKDGRYFHDNLDVVEPRKIWSYVFDEQTLSLESLKMVGIGTAGRYGKYTVEKITF